MKPDPDKIARMAIASAKFEAGNVYLPQEAAWLADLEAKLFAFPGASRRPVRFHQLGAQ